MTKTRDLTDSKDFWRNNIMDSNKEDEKDLCSLCEVSTSIGVHEDLGSICQECLDEQYYCDVCSIWYSKDDPCYFH